MAVDWKITFYFGQASFGWSESWYKNADDIIALKPAIEGYLKIRADMLGVQVSILGVRCSQVNTARVGRVFIAGLTPITNTDPPVNLTIPEKGNLAEDLAVKDPLSFDQIRACIRVETMAGQRRIGYKYLAGIPDQVSLTEPKVTSYQKPAVWWAAFKRLRAFIPQNLGVYATRLYNGTEDKLIVRWDKADAAPALIGAAINVADPINPGVGVKVALTGVRMKASGIRTPNGSWIVDHTSTGENSTQVIWLRNSELVDVTAIKSLGRIRLATPHIQAVTDLEPFRVGTHKRGGPFGQLRGRQTRKTYLT